MRILLQVEAGDRREGFTLGELRGFLARCQLVDAPDDAYVRALQSRAFNGNGGRLRRLTVEADDQVADVDAVR